MDRWKEVLSFLSYYVIILIRFISFCLFAYDSFSIHIDFKSLRLLAIFVLSIILPKILKQHLFDFTQLQKKPIILNVQDKKKSTKEILQSLYPPINDSDLDREVQAKITEFVTYDPEVTESLERFDIIKQNSECIFAKKAKIWGSPTWNKDETLDSYVFRFLPTFLKFTLVCYYKRIDAFLIEIPQTACCHNIKAFGETLRKILHIMSDRDPNKVCCMNSTNICRPGWVFEFNKVTFFITTFAPFYPENHSRYAFGAKNSYILFQPELSFAWHDLPSDTVETSWHHPRTVRDRIRIAFRNAGRRYDQPPKGGRPMVLDMLPPINRKGCPVEWWKSDSGSS